MVGIVRKRIVVSGRVQGVGFRYRAIHAAESLGLTRWVRNDPCGTVTMELQGKKELICQVIPMIEGSHWISIDEWTEEDIPTDDSEHSFGVVR